MDSATLAEMKERLNKLPVAPYPRTPKTSISNSESLALEPRTPERTKSISSNSSLDNTNQTTTDSNVSSSSLSSISNETSVTREAILARYRQTGANNTSGFIKPPVPLPSTNNQTQNEISSARDTKAAHFNQQNVNKSSNFKKPPPPPVPTETGSQPQNDISNARNVLAAHFNQQNVQKDSSVKKPPVALTEESSQPQNEISNARDAIAAHFRQQGANNTSAFKKPAALLPYPGAQPRKDSISSELSSSPQDTTTNRTLTPDINRSVTTSQKKSPSPIPVPSSNEIENTYAELSNDPSNSSSSTFSPISNQTLYEGFNSPSASLSNSITVDQPDTTQSESLSVSLDTILPSQCMFFQFETIIHDYQRRNPQTITYPKIKPTMPKITSEEINTLQKYLNT